MYDILDLHTHTTASGHAYNSLFEMVKAASDKGLTLFGCSDHAPAMPGSCHEFHFINFKVIPRELFGVRLLMGAELNILDYEGNVDLPPSILDHLDYCIASLHPPCYKSSSAEQNTTAYLNVMKNPYVQIIGHPDDGRFPIDYKTLVQAARENHKLLEMNSSSLHPQSSRPGARENYLTMLELCREYGQPIIINSDAHIAPDAGNHACAHALLEEIHFPEELVVNTSMDQLGAYIPKLAELLAGRWA